MDKAASEGSELSQEVKGILGGVARWSEATWVRHKVSVANTAER